MGLRIRRIRSSCHITLTTYSKSFIGDCQSQHLFPLKELSQAPYLKRCQTNAYKQSPDTKECHQRIRPLCTRMIGMLVRRVQCSQKKKSYEFDQAEHSSSGPYTSRTINIPHIFLLSTNMLQLIMHCVCLFLEPQQLCVHCISLIPLGNLIPIFGFNTFLPK